MSDRSGRSRWLRGATAVTAGVALMAACSGNVRLPSPVAAPATTPSTAPATAPGATTTTVADSSRCVPDPLGTRDPDHSPTRSYAPTIAENGTAVLPTPGAMPPGTTMAAISQRKLIVGVSADTLLFGARNAQTGMIEGFDVDMLKAVATAIFGPQQDATGKPLDITSKMEFRVIPYSQRLPRLQSTDPSLAVDLVAHTMTINCARWQQIAFSTEYFSAGQRVLVKKGSGYGTVQDLDVAKARVCAPAGSTNLDELSDTKKYPGLKLSSEPDITDCLVEMQQGKADAASGDDTVLAGFAKQDPTTEVVGPTFTDEPYGIGVNGDAAHVDLVQFVNSVIEQMRTDGEWKALYAKWLVPTLAATNADIPAPPKALYGRPEPTS